MMYVINSRIRINGIFIQCDPYCSMTTRFECVTDRLNRLESVEPHRLSALTEQSFVYSRGRKFIITASLEAAGGKEEEEELIIFWKGGMFAVSCNLFGTALHVEFVGETLKCSIP